MVVRFNRTGKDITSLHFNVKFDSLMYQESLAIDVSTCATVECYIRERFVADRRVDHINPETYILLPKRNKGFTKWRVRFPFDDDVEITLATDIRNHLLWHGSIEFRGHYLEFPLPDLNPRHRIVTQEKAKPSPIYPTRFERTDVI